MQPFTKTLTSTITAAFLSGVMHAQPIRNVADEILVAVKPHMSEQAAQALFEVHGGQEVDTIPQINVHVLRVPADKRDRVLDALQHNPNIQFAEANTAATASATANDPYYSSQWHLAKIQAPQAWDITKGA